MKYEEDSSTTQVDGNYCGYAYYMLLVLFSTYGVCIRGKWNYIGVSSNIFVKVIDSKYVYLCSLML